MTRNETTVMNDSFAVLIELLTNLDAKLNTFDEKFNTKIETVRSDIANLSSRISVVETKFKGLEDREIHKSMVNPILIATGISGIISIAVATISHIIK
jgi:hypothetical protein